MTNLILLVHRDSKPKSAYIKVKMWTLTSNWVFLNGLYWDLSKLLLQERHPWLFLMWTHSLMCRESYSVQSRSLVFQYLPFLLSTFNSFVVSCERSRRLVMCQPATLAPPGETDGTWNSHLSDFLWPRVFTGTSSRPKKFDQNYCSYVADCKS